jgi:hypothetical protein
MVDYVNTGVMVLGNVLGSDRLRGTYRDRRREEE